MFLERRMQNFRKVAQLETLKNREELNMTKSKNWKNSKKYRKFFEKLKI